MNDLCTTLGPGIARQVLATGFGNLTPAAGAFRRLCVDDDGVRCIGLSRDSPSAASTAVTRRWSPPRLPSYG